MHKDLIATRLPRITDVLSLEFNSVNQDIRLTVKTEDEHSYEITMHPDVVGVLSVALLPLAGTVGTNTSKRDMVACITNLTGARPAIGSKGELLLVLRLENGVKFPVAFPSQAIRTLRAALTELEKTIAPDHPCNRKH